MRSKSKIGEIEIWDVTDGNQVTVNVSFVCNGWQHILGKVWDKTCLGTDKDVLAVVYPLWHKMIKDDIYKEAEAFVYAKKEVAV